MKATPRLLWFGVFCWAFFVFVFVFSVEVEPLYSKNIQSKFVSNAVLTSGLAAVQNVFAFYFRVRMGEGEKTINKPHTNIANHKNPWPETVIQ